jgi:branched-chain amino acid transport system substrate-binding protein
MMTQLTLIKNSSPQAVICWGTSPGPAIVARNMTTLGMTIPLFCSHGIAFQSFITAAGSSANGVIFPCGKLPIADNLSDADPQKALLVKYRDDFNATYGNGTANTFGGHAYDSLNIVVTALKNAVDETPDKIKSSDDTLQTVRAKIRDYIENNINSTGFPETGGFPGTGGIFNMSADNHNGLPQSCLVMVKIVDGKWTPAE